MRLRTQVAAFALACALACSVSAVAAEADDDSVAVDLILHGWVVGLFYRF